MILFYNIGKYTNLIDTSLIQAVADYCELVQGISLNTSMTIEFVENNTIKAINKDMRNINKETDVLSFPTINMLADNYITNKSLESAYDIDTNSYYIGDAVISVDMAQKQALEYNHSFNREIAYLVTHSIFHLFGYDHLENRLKKEMRIMEEKVLTSLNISRDQEVQISDKTLAELAIKAMEKAYVPYSNFPVGACLLSKDGRIFQGCNIENASYGVTVCAERTALFKAISEGVREFEAIAISGKGIKPYPCGICRQALNEFSKDIKVIVTNELGEFETTTLTKLLPHSFGPESLGK